VKKMLVTLGIRSSTLGQPTRQVKGDFLAEALMAALLERPGDRFRDEESAAA
jgi:hypothetical protein